MRQLAKILALLAVLLMPLGMTAAPAAAHSHGGSAAQAMPMSHCPESTHGNRATDGIVSCAMVCSVALPALGAPLGARLRVTCEPVRPALVDRLDDLHPETATPPPRHS